MATAVFVAPVQPSMEPQSSPTSEARKRRREILQGSKRAPEVVISSNPKRKVLDSATVSPKKKQMKYDPDVPMTKEEATAWRREQRRKRNRQSAAASRQRQRDRISELEQQVEDYQKKFKGILEKIRLIEAAKGVPTPFRATTPVQITTTTVTPKSSPTPEANSVSEDEDSSPLLPSNMISRQATS